MKESAIKEDKAEISTTAGMVDVESPDHLERYWRDDSIPLKWDCLFMLPPWLGVWWSYFGPATDAHLFVVREHDTVLGVAPLRVDRDTAHLIGDSDLIDYSDFMIVPSRERAFFSILLDYLRRQGISRFETGRVRADSAAVAQLQSYSATLHCDVSCDSVDVLYEMDLPDTWEGYLAALSGRERHETRRKLRRFESTGQARLRVIQGEKDLSDAMDTFLELFRSNRTEKAQFMTSRREAFFKAMAVEMARAGMLKLFQLEVNDAPAAAVMCFDYRSTVYLYNNGYDRRFNHLSVGLLSKVFSIRESIMLGRKKYNFLRGDETYKGRLGGHPVRLLQCKVMLK